jgi:hypothetical protein
MFISVLTTSPLAPALNQFKPVHADSRCFFSYTLVLATHLSLSSTRSLSVGWPTKTVNALLSSLYCTVDHLNAFLQTADIKRLDDHQQSIAVAQSRIWENSVKNCGFFKVLNFCYGRASRFLATGAKKLRYTPEHSVTYQNREKVTLLYFFYHILLQRWTFL